MTMHGLIEGQKNRPIQYKISESYWWTASKINNQKTPDYFKKMCY